MSWIYQGNVVDIRSKASIMAAAAKPVSVAEYGAAHIPRGEPPEQNFVEIITTRSQIRRDKRLIV